MAARPRANSTTLRDLHDTCVGSGRSSSPVGRADYMYIHLYSPERQQQQVKEAPDAQQQKTNKKGKETTLKAGELVNSVTTFIYLRTLKHLLTSVNINLRQRTR